MSPTDEELVELAVAGDIESFKQLYERHYRMAVSIARSRLGDVHLAEDAAQEAFVVVRDKLSMLRNRKRFPQWLGTIVRRTASSTAAFKSDSVSLFGEPVGRVEEIGQDISEVRTAIDELSDSHREVIFLRYFGNLSHEEIASTLATSPQSVHGLLQRARKSLAKKLNTKVNQ